MPTLRLIVATRVLPLAALWAQRPASQSGPPGGGRGPSPAAREAEALAEPYRGITTHGTVQPGLFPVRSTGVSIRDHIHVVVRTPNGNDYGKDLLRQHLERHPH